MNVERPRLALAIPLDSSAASGAGAADRPALETAVADLFEAHYVSLTRLAAAVLRDPSWAEDVVQECFAQIQLKWSALRDQDRALAYLRAAVINRSRTELRRRRLRAGVGTDQSSETAPRAEDTVMERLRNSALLNAISDLPRRQREITLLRFLHELTIAETADVLNISQGAVMASQSRAIHSLRARLGEAI